MHSLLFQALALTPCAVLRDAYTTDCCQRPPNTTVAADFKAPGVSVLLTTFLQGDYSSSGIPLAQGFRDWISHHNADQSNMAVRVVECETSYDVEFGKKCIADNVADVRAAVCFETTLSLSQAFKLGTLGVSQISAGYGEVFNKLSMLGDAHTSHSFYPAANYADALSALKTYAGHDANTRIAFIGRGDLYTNPTAVIFKDRLGYNSTLWLTVNLPSTNIEASITENMNSVADHSPDAVYIMSFNNGTRFALQTLKDIGFDMSKVFCIWWGADAVEESGIESTGVKVLSYFDPLHNPLGARSFYETIGTYSALVFTETLRMALHNMQTSKIFDADLTSYRTVTATAVHNALATFNLSSSRLSELGLTEFMSPCVMALGERQGCDADVFVLEWMGNEWKRLARVPYDAGTNDPVAYTENPIFGSFVPYRRNQL